MVWWLFIAKTLPEPMIIYGQKDLKEKNKWNFNENIKFFIQQKESECEDHDNSCFQRLCQWCGVRLTHWGRVTHLCVSKLIIIGSDNGLSPGRRQAIIRTNAGILLIRPLGTNFSEFLIKILIFSFKKMRLKVSSAKRRPFCLGLNELIVDKILTISNKCELY